MARGRPRKDRVATQTATPAPESQLTLEPVLFLAANKLRKNLEPWDFRELVHGAADNIDRLTHLADGFAYPAVRQDFVANAFLVLYPPALISAFSMPGGPMLYMIEANKRGSRTLAPTRDFLLPKLMSGEIRVREAEAVLAAIA